MDIAGWLHELGLEQYEAAFRANEIDARVLPRLTPEDLKDLGVTLVGHRRRLLDAIAALGNAKAPTSPAVPPLTDAERRQLTVMFCDLVGSTQLSVRRDPEDLRDLIAGYHHAVNQVVKRFDGFVARYMGDGILIYFGYPQAHEDDAERAARCALTAVEAVSNLKLGAELRARIGIATGMVVVGGGAPAHDVVGETPNLAARLQTSAEPNTVLIDETTRRLTGGLFEYRALGAVEARGFTETVLAWKLLRPSAVASRFEALRASSPTPLIGRSEELEFLLHQWERARKGDGRVVLLSGEPGIGKSRVTAALAERLREEPYCHLRYFCAPHHQGTALYPVITHLEHAAGFARGDSAATKLEKLSQLFGQGRLGHLRRRVAAHAGRRSRNSEQETELLLLAVAGVRQALVADLLSLPTAGALAGINLSPQHKKERTFEALLGLLEDLSRKRPVLMVFEDVHWIDPTSRELLDLAIERSRRLAVLLIITFRPEFQQAWSGPAHLSALLLNRLDADKGIALARAVAGKALPDEVVTHIAARTDGVPLFVEELTRAILEGGLLRDAGDRYAVDRPIPPVAIPPSLQASLLARLDRLGPKAKELAQLGAAIGRDFSYELLSAATRWPATELGEALGRLVDAGLVFQRGFPSKATFLFKHALVQDSAYGTLLRRARKSLHAKIADALEQQFPSIVEAQPEIVAHHFTEAGRAEKAVNYWSRASEQSLQKSALIEAIEQARRGLRLIADYPDSRERKLQELGLQITLAGALTGIKGPAHPESAEAFGRARDLVFATEGTATLLYFSVLFGLWVAAYIGGKPKAALDRAEEFLSTAPSHAGSGLLSIGHRLVGTTLLTIGDFPAAGSHLERAVALLAPAEHRTLGFRFGADIGVTALCVLAWSLWHQGYPDRASKAAQEGVRQARAAAQLHTFAWACPYIGLAGIAERHVEKVEKLADELVAIADKRSFPLSLGWGSIFQGWVMAQRGEGKAAVEKVRGGLAAARATGSFSHEAIFFGIFAEALAAAGAIDEALAVLAEALAIAEATGARGNDAELHRLQGDLLRRLSNSELTEPEGAYRTALAVAREQGTRGFELRAAISLTHLLREQQRRKEAREVLAPVYGWFTEGFDTPDLKDAKALLDELR